MMNLYMLNAVLFGLLFVVWSKDSGLNLIIKIVLFFVGVCNLLAALKVI